MAVSDHAGNVASSPADVELDAGQGWLLYGVVPAGTVLPDGLTGVDGSPVTTIPCGEVAGVVGAIALDRPPGRRAELVAYHEVVDALAVSGPAAPVQFGTVLPDRQAVVEDFLGPHEHQLADLLAELAGRRQFNLRADYVEDVVLAEIVQAEPEIRELRELTKDQPEDAVYGERVRLGKLVATALEVRSAADAEALMEAIVPLVAIYNVRDVRGSEHVLDAALLVDEERADEFIDRLEDLAEAVHERMRLRLVGPVAAYDFVGGL